MSKTNKNTDKNTVAATTNSDKDKDSMNVEKLLKKAQNFSPEVRNHGRKSILEPYEKVIRTLREEKNASYKEITSFLTDEGIKTTQGNLQQYIRKNMKDLVNERVKS